MPYYVYRTMRNYYVTRQLRLKGTADVFREIYTRNAWRGQDSVSGTGSDSHQTRVVASELPLLLNAFNISTMLDIPCGDFYWMNSVKLNGIDYIGADIVKDLILSNEEKYKKNNVRFENLDLIRDKLPGFVGREKFQDGVVFIFSSEAADALAAVNVENPHRDSVFSGNPREEISKRLSVIVVLNYKFALFI